MIGHAERRIPRPGARSGGTVARNPGWAYRRGHLRRLHTGRSLALGDDGRRRRREDHRPPGGRPNWKLVFDGGTAGDTGYVFPLAGVGAVVHADAGVAGDEVEEVQVDVLAWAGGPAVGAATTTPQSRLVGQGISAQVSPGAVGTPAGTDAHGHDAVGHRWTGGQASWVVCGRDGGGRGLHVGRFGGRRGCWPPERWWWWSRWFLSCWRRPGAWPGRGCRRGEARRRPPPASVGPSEQVVHAGWSSEKGSRSGLASTPPSQGTVRGTA